MHRSDTTQRVEVVHHREHTFLHFTTVPSVQDNLFLSSQVEYNCSFWVQTQFFVVFNFSLRSVVNNEIRFEVFQLFFRRTDEHVSYEVSLPCNFHDETNFQTSSFVSTAITVNNEQFLVWQFFCSQVFQYIPSFCSYRLVIVFIFFRSPPYSVFTCSVFYQEFIFRRTTSVDTSHYVYCTQFSFLTFFEAFQTSFCFFCEQNFVRRIVYDFYGSSDTVLSKI